jgi:autotransporter passenger strand-loop-strand repeat protein
MPTVAQYLPVWGCDMTTTRISGRTVSGGVVGRHDRYVVFSGGILDGTIVENGGFILDSAGGKCKAVNVVDGSLWVSRGGVAAGTLVGSDGLTEGFGGSILRNTHVAEGGVFIVGAWAVASDTKLKGGTEVIAAGGIVDGTTVFGAHAELIDMNLTGISLTTSGFKATDTIDLNAFRRNAAETLSFVENAAKTKGVLTITDGKRHASITLFGQYVAAGFHHAWDGGTGTAITYTAPTTAHVDLVAAGR